MAGCREAGVGEEGGQWTVDSWTVDGGQVDGGRWTVDTLLLLLLLHAVAGAAT